MGGNLMRRGLVRLAASIAFAGCAVSVSAAPLPRIVSMNVCTDQMLLTLADPEQILGLTRLRRHAAVIRPDLHRPHITLRRRP